MKGKDLIILQWDRSLHEKTTLYFESGHAQADETIKMLLMEVKLAIITMTKHQKEDI